jgi:putative endonuclease
MFYYTYILYSQSRDRYYIGSTTNLEQRLIRHNAGATPSTKAGRPWVIVYTEAFDSKTEALKRENYLKRMKSRSFIENLIKKAQGRPDAWSVPIFNREGRPEYSGPSLLETGMN